MPGHFDCCFLPVLDWLAENMPGTPLSLLMGFLPVFRSAEHEELMRIAGPGEEARAREALAKAAAERGVTLAPWRLSLPAGIDAGDMRGLLDEIWIDRAGRIRVDSASAGIVSCLKRLAPELIIGDLGTFNRAGRDEPD